MSGTKQCHKCNRSFQRPSGLRAHLHRKHPCVVDVEVTISPSDSGMTDPGEVKPADSAVAATVGAAEPSPVDQPADLHEESVVEVSNSPPEADEVDEADEADEDDSPKLPDLVKALIRHQSQMAHIQHRSFDRDDRREEAEKHRDQRREKSAEKIEKIVIELSKIVGELSKDVRSFGDLVSISINHGLVDKDVPAPPKAPEVEKPASFKPRELRTAPRTLLLRV